MSNNNNFTTIYKGALTCIQIGPDCTYKVTLNLGSKIVEKIYDFKEMNSKGVHWITKTLSDVRAMGINPSSKFISALRGL